MKKTFRKVQFLSNIATIVIAVLLTFVIVKQNFFPTAPLENSVSSVKTIRTSSQPIATPSKNLPVSPLGKLIPINGVDWKKNKKTLVMYISSTCHFCKESEPFYKRFLKDTASGEVKFMAVMPQPVEEAKDYLKTSGLQIEDVYNAQLGSIGVTGTPTLLLIDENGIVSEIWKGKLSSDKELEVLNKLSS